MKSVGRSLRFPRLEYRKALEQVAEHADQRLQRDVAGEHEAVVLAPHRLHHLAHRFEIIPDQRVRPIGFQLPPLLEQRAMRLNDFVHLIEQLRL